MPSPGAHLRILRAALVSIIIPCHNAAPWLTETIESALGQTWPNIEIIVIDDGSTDESHSIVRGFEARGVRVIAQPNAGASAARNHGLRVARGDFIQFLDADDLLAPEKIERQMARLASEPADIIASGAWARFQQKPATAEFHPEPVWRDFPHPMDFFIPHYNEGWMMPPIAWLVPRLLADAAGPWNEQLSLNDDGEYFCRVLSAARKIAFCEDARSFYRSGLVGSLSRRKDERALRSLLLSIELNTATLLRDDPSPALRSALANAWQKLAYDLYPDLIPESRAAAGRARELGGANRRWEAGGRMQLLGRLIGWRGAKRIERAWNHVTSIK